MADATAIRASAGWQAKGAKRLKPLDPMTAQDRADFQALMNRTFPKRAGR